MPSKLDKTYIIFTDLDGTLLDSDTYSFKAAEKAIEKIKKREIPLIICTSKTREEIEKHRKKLFNTHPFISENGGGIFIPKGYHDFNIDATTVDKRYLIIQLGVKYSKLRAIIKKIRETGISIKGFGDMSIEEIKKETGLSITRAASAKKREFDEAFMIKEKDKRKVSEIITRHKFKMTQGGRFYHITGNSDKGKAVKMLTSFYKRKYKNIITIGLGDTKNDYSMLDCVDIPILVQKKDGTYSSDNYKKADGIGPVGWNKAVLEVIRE